MDAVFDRIGHVAVVHRNNVIVWGGYKVYEFTAEDVRHHSTYHDPAEIVVFNPSQSRCVVIETRGEIPPPNSGACGLVAGNHFYVFGGYFSDPDYDCNTNTLYSLNLRTLVWTKLSPEGTEPLPCDKLFGWEFENKLYFFGGFGPPPVFPHRESHRFQLSPHYPQPIQNFIGRCWNNQLVQYDIERNEWKWPRLHGEGPSPRAAHTGFTHGSKVYLFGGRLDSQRMNDLYVLDLRTMTWSENLTKNAVTLPCGRSWHSFTLVSPTSACLYGGFSSAGEPLGDVWLYHITTNTWEASSKWCGGPRLWHQSVCIEGELIAVGGLQTNITNFQLPQVHAHDLFSMRFSPRTLSRACLDFAAQVWDENSPCIQSLPLHLKRQISVKKQNKVRINSSA